MIRMFIKFVEIEIGVFFYTVKHILIVSCMHIHGRRRKTYELLYPSYFIVLIKQTIKLRDTAPYLKPFGTALYSIISNKCVIYYFNHNIRCKSNTL